MMKSLKAVIALVAAVASGSLVASCSDDSNSSGGKVLTIGISQIAQNPGIDDARVGFKKAFADAGYVEGRDVKFEEKNAQGELATASTIANKFAAEDLDMVLAITTPSAQAAAQVITKIPVLFTAVTEPQKAGLVDSWEKPGGNMTGTSDLNPVKQQIELIKTIVPKAKSVGVIYNSGEINSKVQVDLAKDAAKGLGMTLKLSTVTTSSEISQGAESLGDVDAIYLPTDNKVTEGLEAIIGYAEQHKIPVIAGEGGQVERGAIATYGLNYSELGHQTGEMALKILRDGADPGELPVQTQTKYELIVNPKAAERMGVTLPADLLAKADKSLD